MHSAEQRILNTFKKEPLKEFSTTEIARATYPELYARIIRDINIPTHDKKTMQKARRKKGQLHRKVLYHLNKLVEEDILRVSKIRGKGEKYFALAIEEGELVIEKKHKKIIISKPSVSTSLIDKYEAQKIIHKFDPAGWVNKINCILLESHLHTGLNKFYDLIYKCFSEINDAIGLNNFGYMIENSSQDNLREFIKKIDIDTKDHERYVSLILNMKNIRDDKKTGEFIKAFAETNPRNVSLILKTESQQIRNHKPLFNTIIDALSEEEIKLNIQNNRVHRAPIIIGKAGPYTLKKEEWHDYKHNIRGKTKGLAISNTTIAIDVHRFFQQELGVKDFRSLLLKAAQTLLKINTTQKKKANEYFKILNNLNKPYTKKFFAYSKNYMRFWNYDWREKKHEHIIELMESSKNEINNFCKTQQTIYKACGIPFNFDIVFSSVFSKYTQDLSSRRYIKTSIHKFQDYHDPLVSSFISTREKLFKIFEGGDRIRFFRTKSFEPEELIRELSFLMNTYALPLITYDFKERKGGTKLTSYFQT